MEIITFFVNPYKIKIRGEKNVKRNNYMYMYYYINNMVRYINSKLYKNINN